MATGKLAIKMAAGMQSYIAGLSPPKQDNYDFQDGYNAIFNQTEDFWNKIVEIDDDYTVPENEGSMAIIVKSTGVTADPVIELPAIATNIGRRLFFINENAGYRAVIIPKSGSSDNIEGFSVLDIMQSTHKNRIELIATVNGWRRKAREFVLVPENLRPSGWVLNGGTAGTWTDVSFLTWVQEGAYALLLLFAIQQIGNDVDDSATFVTRPKGSTIDSLLRNTPIGTRYDNLASGVTMSYVGQVKVACDNNATIQYRKQIPAATNAVLFLTINGYWK